MESSLIQCDFLGVFMYCYMSETLTSCVLKQRCRNEDNYGYVGLSFLITFN